MGVRLLNSKSGPTPGYLALGEEAPWAFGIEGYWGLFTGAPQDWGKQRLHSWKGTCRFSHALGPRAKQSLHRNLGQTWMQFLVYLLVKQRVNVAICGGRAMEAKLSGIFMSVHFSGGGHFGKIWPTHQSALRGPRANNNPGGMTALPLSKQAT